MLFSLPVTIVLAIKILVHYWVRYRCPQFPTENADLKMWQNVNHLDIIFAQSVDEFFKNGAENSLPSRRQTLFQLSLFPIERCDRLVSML